eukprot:g973.t2
MAPENTGRTTKDRRSSKSSTAHDPSSVHYMPSEMRVSGHMRREKLDTVIGIVVLLNSLTMAMELECEGQVAGERVGMPELLQCHHHISFYIAEHVFTIIFVLELAWRLRFAMGGGASSGAKRKAPKERAPEGVVPSKPRHADEYLRQVQADRKAKRSTKGRATCSTCSTGCTSRLTNQSLTSERSQRSVRSKGTSGTPKSVRFAGQMEDVLDARTAQWPEVDYCEDGTKDDLTRVLEDDEEHLTAEPEPASNLAEGHESSPPRHALPERMEAELPAPKEVEAAEVPKALTATGEELVKAIEAEDWCSAEKILTERPEDCDVNARTSDWNYCLLRAAAEEGASETCRKLLEHQADVNARDQNNMTALMGCIVGGDYHDIVRMLLEARADGAAVTDDGFTALKWATRLNRKESVELLRSVGMRGEASAFS